MLKSPKSRFCQNHNFSKVIIGIGQNIGLFFRKSLYKSDIKWNHAPLGLLWESEPFNVKEDHGGPPAAIISSPTAPSVKIGIINQKPGFQKTGKFRSLS